MIPSSTNAERKLAPHMMTQPHPFPCSPSFAFWPPFLLTGVSGNQPLLAAEEEAILSDMDAFRVLSKLPIGPPFVGVDNADGA